MFIKHHIRPLRIRGKRVPWPARAVMEKAPAIPAGGLSDADTIGKGWPLPLAKYHYNAVENSIIDLHHSGKIRSQRPRILDVGSGAGHWIDFYRQIMGADFVMGVDLSPSRVEFLRDKYRGMPDIVITEADIAQEGLDLAQSFDIINAIGILFHITDDRIWLQALHNLSRHLRSDGVIVVGGWFGCFTRDVQFMWPKNSPGEVWVHKRIRSRRQWEVSARRAGLRIIALKKTYRLKNFLFPENNILVLRKD